MNRTPQPPSPACHTDLRASLFATLDWEDEQMVPALGLPGGTEFDDPAWRSTEHMALHPQASAAAVEAIRGLQVRELGQADEADAFERFFVAGDLNH